MAGRLAARIGLHVWQHGDQLRRRRHDQGFVRRDACRKGERQEGPRLGCCACERGFRARRRRALRPAQARRRSVHLQGPDNHHAVAVAPLVAKTGRRSKTDTRGGCPQLFLLKTPKFAILAEVCYTEVCYTVKHRCRAPQIGVSHQTTSCVSTKSYNLRSTSQGKLWGQSPSLQGLPPLCNGELRKGVSPSRQSGIPPHDGTKGTYVQCPSAIPLRTRGGKPFSRVGKSYTPCREGGIPVWGGWLPRVGRSAVGAGRPSSICS